MTAPLSSLADHADERFTAEQRAKLAEFDAAPVPPEVVVENVARAIHDTELCLAWPCDYSDMYRKYAAAAIAALPPSPAEEAVKRVARLADELQWLVDDETVDETARVAHAWTLHRLRAALDPS